MIFFDKKAQEVEELFTKHVELIGECIQDFQKMFDDYLVPEEEFDEQKFKDDAYRIHITEEKADNARRKIEVLLYAGAFLPIYREDYVMLAEYLDKIANKVEAAADFVVLTRPKIPEIIEEEVKELVNKTIATYKPMKEAIEHFNSGSNEELFPELDKISLLESEVDSIEWKILKKLFALKEFDLSEKLFLRTLILDIGKISNTIEDAADRFRLVVVKRNL